MKLQNNYSLILEVVIAVYLWLFKRYYPGILDLVLK